MFDISKLNVVFLVSCVKSVFFEPGMLGVVRKLAVEKKL